MKILLLTIGLLLFAVTANAQEFLGTATYKTSSKISIKIDSTSASFGMQEELQAMLKKRMQKEYVLTFNKEASVWKEEESLGGAVSSSGGIMIDLSSGGGTLYKNTKEKNFTENKSLFGKQFLVKDSLAVTDWKLESDTKQIGQYTCYKATYTKEISISRFTPFSSEKEASDTEKEAEKETKIKTITAWYTPQIPVNHGPDDYWGLPGLILEVSNGSKVMICTKVVINPKDKIEILAPTKGKKITADAYEAIVKEKMKEMSKMYSGGRKKGNGGSQTISIKFGG